MKLWGFCQTENWNFNTNGAALRNMRIELEPAKKRNGSAGKDVNLRQMNVKT
jgi:hypothetical protein